MHIDLQKEQFSLAYLHAVATVAGFALSDPRVDEDSIDITVSASGRGQAPRRPKLDVQLKCTSSHMLYEDGIHFRLERKNYDELRVDGEEAPIVSHILVVLLVPENCADWMLHTEQELILRHCAYWCSLKGMPPIPKDTQDKITVLLPRRQVLTPDALNDIMQRIGNRRDV